MIAKAKAIPHGHTNLAYIMGESKKKEHTGEKIQFVTSHGLDPFHRAAEAWEEIKRACRDHPDMKNTVVRFILSPEKEDTKNFTIDDWERLWEEYLEAFDTLDHRNDKGELISSLPIFATASTPSMCISTARVVCRIFMRQCVVLMRMASPILIATFIFEHKRPRR